MTTPPIDPDVRDAFDRVQRVTLAHRILPEHLKQYVHLPAIEIDWLGLVEAVDRPLSINPSATANRAAVALVAHLLGFEEALRVAPAPTFMGLLEIVDHDTRGNVLAAVMMMHALLEL